MEIAESAGDDEREKDDDAAAELVAAALRRKQRALLMSRLPSEPPDRQRTMRVVGALIAFGLLPSGGTDAIRKAAEAEGQDDVSIDSEWREIPSKDSITRAFTELMRLDFFSLTTTEAVSARLVYAILFVLYGALTTVGGKVEPSSKVGLGPKSPYNAPGTDNQPLPYSIEHALKIWGASHEELFGNVTKAATPPAPSSALVSRLIAIIEKVRRGAAMCSRGVLRPL